MHLHFRPLLGLTVAAAIAFTILVGLGVWQIQRLHWKLGLIAAVDRNLTAPPISLDKALAMGTIAAQYHRVVLEGVFENDRQSYVFATDADGNPVLHVIVPFVTARGTLLVDRGIVPYRMPAEAYRAGEMAGPTRVVGVWRVPDAPGWFTPSPDRVRQIWYSRDVNAIAREERVFLLAPVLVEADATPNRGRWPKGGQTEVHFRNEHLQYAITWFALAAGLLVIYFAYHRARGRLRFD